LETKLKGEEGVDKKKGGRLGGQKGKGHYLRIVLERGELMAQKKKRSREERRKGPFKRIRPRLRGE